MTDYQFESQVSNSGILAYGVKGKRFYEIYLIQENPENSREHSWRCFHFYKEFTYKCDVKSSHYMTIKNINGGRNRLKNLMAEMDYLHCVDCNANINPEKDQHVYCPKCNDFYCYDCMVHKKKPINPLSNSYQIPFDVQSFAINDKYLLVWTYHKLYYFDLGQERPDINEAQINVS